MTAFAELGVRTRTVDALARTKIDKALPVQRDAIPPLLQHRDVVMHAPTGSGKTLAYLIPLVERLAGHRTVGPRALVVTPTRELASQIAGVLRTVDPALRVALLLGGVGYGPQMSTLRNSADVVIGCPGRILDLADRGVARLGNVEFLVLDEADEMLDQGFARDVERIIALTPARTAGSTISRQTVLASATMPDWVQTMIVRHLVDAVNIVVEREQEPLLRHGLVRVGRDERVSMLSELLKRHGDSAIVFHRTKHGAARLARDLDRLGHRTLALQGNLSQNARDRAINDFRNRRADVLVATNVAARGLDVAHVGLVVNVELPETPQWLTHRVGRTARNGAEGTALTFLGDDDMEKWRRLQRLGAPALRWVDRDALLNDGTLVFLETPVLPRPQQGRPAQAGGARGAARPYRGGPPNRGRRGGGPRVSRPGPGAGAPHGGNTNTRRPAPAR
ncbi:MAG TPA: DEAD/DEAH box helicase [Candidatus Dormibacteraeota bacterium]|jgi:ATP-dependent RNA helicase RhlE|nr:DEAD/DEAH box helicase [Candidatus Dormibacteraeota bacterium]